jgi:hypothetical protein
MGRTIMNDKYVIIWKKAVVACFKELNVAGKKEEAHYEHQS